MSAVTIRAKAVYYAGYVAGSTLRLIGKFSGLGWLFARAEFYRLQIENRDALEAKRRDWKTKIDPRVRIAKDEFGFSHGQLIRRDTTRMSADEIFHELAEYAATKRTAHIAETGVRVATMSVWGKIVTANRCINVSTAMVFQEIDPGEPERVNVIHPAAERCRWQHLERAIKCFLN